MGDVFELVDSTEELNAFFGDYYNDTYNDSFFEKKSIIVVTIRFSDSSWRCRLNNVYIKDSVLTVDIDVKHRISGGALTMVWHLTQFIEVKKSEIKDITDIQKNLTVEEVKEWEDDEW